jgi:hypothetical protein
MARRDSSPSLPPHRSVFRALDWLIAREKHIRLLGALSLINLTCMRLKLDFICGGRGPFPGATAWLWCWLLPSGRLGKHTVSSLCCRPKYLDQYKPRGALPLTKCCFFHSLLWVRTIGYLGGDGGWWIEEMWERSAGYGITEMLVLRKLPILPTLPIILNHVVFFKLKKYHIE